MVAVSGRSNVFELQCVDEWFQAIRHLRRGIRVDDEYGPHVAESGVATVAVFTHWRVVVLCYPSSYVSCPA